MRIHDISLPLDAALAPWPGDTPFGFRLNWAMSAGAAVNVGAVTMGTHNGTHADAPSHFQPGGVGIDGLPLAPYLGLAVVADLTPRAGGPDAAAASATITRADLAGAAEEFARARRLLLKTGAWPDPRRFPGSIPVLAPDVPGWLGELGVQLFGTDAPSVDTLDSKDLPNHHALAAAGVCILEGLDLRGVPAGVYELIALPLRIVGGDAAPVRAVLREIG